MELAKHPNIIGLKDSGGNVSDHNFLLFLSNLNLSITGLKILTVSKKELFGELPAVCFFISLFFSPGIRRQ